MRITLYQTLENRENPEEVEGHGPYECRRRDAWLGRGYYFWDSHVELAHWWGEKAGYSDYLICSAYATLGDSCFDLHGNGQHRIDLTAATKRLAAREKKLAADYTVREVVEFLRHSGAFNEYSAIRANSIGSGAERDTRVATRLPFHKGKPAFVDLRPPVQLCLFRPKALSLHSYRIVYPAHFVASDFA